MMNNHRPPASELEMQLDRVQRHEKRIRQNTYSPIMYGNEIVALAKFVREDAEPIGRDHPVYLELSAAGEKTALPFFLIDCDANLGYFTVTPGNAAAREHIFCKVEMNLDELQQLFDHCNTYNF